VVVGSQFCFDLCWAFYIPGLKVCQYCIRSWMLLGWSWLLCIWYSWSGSQHWWESLSSEVTIKVDLPTCM